MMFPNSFALASRIFFYIYSLSQLPLNSWGNKAIPLTYLATLVFLPLGIICGVSIFLIALSIEGGKIIKENCSNFLIPFPEEEQELLNIEDTISSGKDTRLLMDNNSKTKRAFLDIPPEITSEKQGTFLAIEDTEDQHLEGETETEIDLGFKLESEPPHYSALYTSKKACLESTTNANEKIEKCTETTKYSISS